MIKELKFFNKVVIPRFVELKVQECALEHLRVPDMYKLRDKYEGQRYFDTLKQDIYSEFAFEKLTFNSVFDWELRRKKSYNRKEYFIEGISIKLISFIPNTWPSFDPNEVQNAVFSFVKPNGVVYTSGLATNKVLMERAHEPVSYNPMSSNLMEFSNFTELLAFEGETELLKLVRNLD